MASSRRTAKPSDFSLAALYTALDAQRQARGLSWAQVASEMNGQSHRRGVHQLSVSTVQGTRTRAIMEADGVLQMLRWLNRAPESFVPGYEARSDRERLPDPAPHQVLRFDTKKLYEVLDARRAELGMTWRELATAIGASPSGLTHLAKGGRTAFPGVMRIIQWLGRPAAEFMRLSDW